MAGRATLTKDRLHRLLQQCPSTPALLMDLSIVEEDYRAFRSVFDDSPIFYAIKANPHQEILKRLASLGSGFEISSVGELRALQALGVQGDRMFSGNTVKTPEFIAEAAKAGMRYFAYDSAAEVDKFVALAPQARLFVRLHVPNDASEWPLDKKFGVESDEALALLAYAKEKGLEPWGIIFHVGSQCRDVRGWRVALEKTRALWEAAERRGIALRVLNVGGGMPVVYTDPSVPGPAAIAQAIFQARAELFSPRVPVWLEPGRAIVGRAGTMVATVIGVATRGGTRWVYLDVGVFHGLAEALGGIKYHYLTDAPGPAEPCTVAGPSCDSMDVIAHDVPLPEVRVGDRVAIAACGAYTTAYSSVFNGFAGPETHIVESALRA